MGMLRFIMEHQCILICIGLTCMLVGWLMGIAKNRAYMKLVKNGILADSKEKYTPSLSYLLRTKSYIPFNWRIIDYYRNLKLKSRCYYMMKKGWGCKNLSTALTLHQDQEEIETLNRIWSYDVFIKTQMEASNFDSIYVLNNDLVDNPNGDGIMISSGIYSEVPNTEEKIVNYLFTVEDFKSKYIQEMVQKYHFNYVPFKMRNHILYVGEETDDIE